MVKIVASLLAANAAHLAEEVREVEEAGIDGLHFDIMDGHYVANFAFGPHIIRSLRKGTSLSMEAHLEIENPHRFIDLFAECGCERIILHPECCPRVEGTLQAIRSLGLSPALAVSPDISVDQVKGCLHLIDMLLIMTVPPGFGGQPFREDMIPKIRKAKEMILASGYLIQIAVDGGIDQQTAPQVVQSGAEILIVGTVLFRGSTVKESLYSLRRSIGEKVFIIQGAGR